MTSNEKLKNIIHKKFTTSMIGGAFALEKRFGVVWDKENKQYVPSEDSNYPLNDDLLDLLSDIRDEILDIGNRELRNLKSEIDEYFEVSQRVYRTNFRIAIEEPK